jgi:MFS transporter, DHA1 family, tetracycline resistance protein
MKRSPLFVIFLTVFLDLLGFGIVIPLAPLYVKQFAAEPALVGRLVGLLGTFYSLMQFLFAPVWGRLSDRVGRRPILLMSISGSCLSYVLFAVAVGMRSLPLLFGSRLIAGAMAANLSTAQAYIADVTTPENRAKGMGMIGAAFGLGFVFGPAVGAWLSQPGFSPVMVPAVAAGLCFLNVVLAAIRLPESLPPDTRAAIPERRRGVRAMAGALADPRVARLVQTLFLVTFAFTMMEWTLALFVAVRFHFGREQAGLLFAALGLLVAFVQGGLVGRLVKRVGEAHLVVAGTLSMALALLLLPTTHTVGSLMAVMALLAFGNGINNPSLSSLTSRAVAPTEQGTILGAAQGFSSLARAVGPFCAGWLFDLGIAYPYLGAALVMAAAFVLSLRVLGQQRAVAAPA